MITINMRRACCGVLGNVSLRSTIHTLAWDTGPARCDTALVYDAELWNPWVSLLTIPLSESVIRHTTGAQPSQMIRCHMRTRERPADRPSVIAVC
jgi:hypothetical protein